ncbi:MAG TPA: TonB family protein, partial [Terricaulis sp.]|nr:TonB family protein [Terricaulis sp.]
ALTERRITEYCAPLGEVLNSDEFRQALTGFYPQRALERGHEGVAVVQLTIIADGTIAEAVVLDELPEGWNFGAAALQALQVVRFPPRAAACENAALSLRFVLR